jgi:hypothetical protein
LPDGIFSNEKYQLGYTLEGLGMKNVGIFYEYLEYLTAIYVVKFVVISVYLFPVLVCFTHNNLATLG